ncbi:hypothetical protein LTR56_020265 [Elasticomyces elasticus]|nr:hypothetical protein LTR56_020265 [Elasticomyces elasticus]KAK3644533.1 hypothetical protein LTR22_015131 [Elasticomyces elasticus]KAK4910385.1 hypothetical protein LTR49_020901 [Elasticomyces elasticus]KAK5750050.1 hypothetical protein LTS12_019855 [Elasticomyces elasticus]
MSNAKQSKGKQALNPFLAFTLIPFLPMDSDGKGKIRSEERTIKEVPREHREHKHRHHHHHHHKSEDSSKSSRHSTDGARHSVDELRSIRSSGDYKSSRRSADVPKSDRNREYFVLERDVKPERSSRH